MKILTENQATNEIKYIPLVEHLWRIPTELFHRNFNYAWINVKFFMKKMITFRGKWYKGVVEQAHEHQDNRYKINLITIAVLVLIVVLGKLDISLYVSVIAMLAGFVITKEAIDSCRPSYYIHIGAIMKKEYKRKTGKKLIINHSPIIDLGFMITKLFTFKFKETIYHLKRAIMKFLLIVPSDRTVDSVYNQSGEIDKEIMIGFIAIGIIAILYSSSAIGTLFGLLFLLKDSIVPSHSVRNYYVVFANRRLKND